MGTEYPCGCRQSAGHTFLCPSHEKFMEVTWSLLKRDKKFRAIVNKENKNLRKMI